jgi:hypothetical protein
MIAIQTKYIGATNTRGSRIKAWTPKMGNVTRSVSIPYPHQLSHELVHFEAVKALVQKFKMEVDITNMRYGGTDDGYVFCFADSIVKE